MIRWLAFSYFASALLLAGCATKNDAGVALHKKPDLSKVTPGTPVNKVAGLKKPISREVITKGPMKGAEAWLFEWDLPNDEVNNKMFTSVAVKDGLIVGYAEETADKWSKDPKLYKAAKFQTAFEDYCGYMAKAARYQMAASMLANYNAYNASRPRPQFDPLPAGDAMFAGTWRAANTMFANSYQPWRNSGTINSGMVGSGPIAYGGGQNSQSIVYPTLPGSSSRDYGRSAVGLRQGDKIYPTLPGSSSRDYGRSASSVVNGGKIYPTLPASSSRDYGRSASGVMEDGKIYPTLPGSSSRDYSKPAIGVVE